MSIPSNPLSSSLFASHAKLLARIERRFQTITQTYAVGPLRLPFVRVADPDVVLDKIVEAEDLREKLTGQRREGNELHLPYWAELWDSAIGIGQMLTHIILPHQPPRVLDLGCGMGFAGMVAAAMGSPVLFADLEADALLFARLNTLRWRDQIRTRQLNWQSDRLNEKFDLIIGADVLYDRSQWDFLEPFFSHHLAPHGTVLLGEPGRQTGDLFPGWIADRKQWKLEPLQTKVPSREKPIRIFQLRQT